MEALTLPRVEAGAPGVAAPAPDPPALPRPPPLAVETREFPAAVGLALAPAAPVPAVFPPAAPALEVPVPKILERMPGVPAAPEPEDFPELAEVLPDAPLEPPPEELELAGVPKSVDKTLGLAAGALVVVALFVVVAAGVAATAGVTAFAGAAAGAAAGATTGAGVAGLADRG
jgi:hypothetical protein